MKKLAILVLAGIVLVMPVMAQPAPGSVGVYFDDAGTTSSTTLAGFAISFLYVLGYDLGGHDGFELAITGLEPATGWSVLARTLRPGALNVGSGDNFIVALGACVPNAEGTFAPTLVQYQYGYFANPVAPNDVAICVGPSTPSSFSPATPGYYDCNDALIPFGFAQCGGGFYPDGCGVVNPTSTPPAICGFSAPDARTSVASIDFGEISVGGFTTRSFQVLNSASATADFEGLISESCEHYTITMGGGPLTLPPGGQHNVTVRFLPLSAGTHDCAITIGPDVADVQCAGTAVLPPLCYVSVDSIAIAPTVIGNPKQVEFFITNLEGGDLEGELLEQCADLEIIQGGGYYRLAAGDTLAVVVEYDPAVEGAISCSISGEGLCDDIAISASAIGAPNFSLSATQLTNGSSRAVTWADIDGDGDEDLYVTRRDLSNVVFENQDGVLVENTPELIATSTNAFSSLWFDQNGDGNLDLLVCNSGEPSLFFVHLPPYGYFPGLSLSPLTAFSQGRVAAPADFDRDGDVDIYIAQVSNLPNALLRAGQEAGSFEVVDTGILEGAQTTTSATWADLDGDGDEDLYVINRNSANRVYRNDQGTFVELVVPALALSGAENDAAWGDYDNDGDLDVFVTAFGSANALLRNEGDFQFSPVPQQFLAEVGMSASPSWVDVDLDRDLDLHYVDGAGIDHLLMNQGGVFYDASLGFIADSTNHSGAAWADFDGDGDPDVALASYDADVPGKLILNESSAANSWVSFELRGVQSNQFALGARVRVVTGSSQQMRWIGTGFGAKSRAGYRALFGLGAAAIVDTVEIRWPSGLVVTEHGLPVNKHYFPHEGGSITAVDGDGHDQLPSQTRLFDAYPNPFNPRTTIRFELAKPTHAWVDVYDLAGRHVKTLLDSSLNAGPHDLVWTGENSGGHAVASGVYLIRLQTAGGDQYSTRVVLVR